MPIEIQVTEDRLVYLSEPAKDEFTQSIDNFIDELLQEASRLEANRRDHRGDPEINRSMIQDATSFLKKYPRAKKMGWGFIAIQVISSVSTLLVGGMFDLDKLQSDQKMLILFIIVLIFAITFTVIEIVMGRNKWIIKT